MGTIALCREVPSCDEEGDGSARREEKEKKEKKRCGHCSNRTGVIILAVRSVQ